MYSLLSLTVVLVLCTACSLLLLQYLQLFDKIASYLPTNMAAPKNSLIDLIDY